MKHTEEILIEIGRGILTLLIIVTVVAFGFGLMLRNYTF